MSSHRTSLSRPEQLVAAGLVGPERLEKVKEVASRYALALMPDVAEIINPENLHDPIASQYIPTKAELTPNSQETPEPIGDELYRPVAGIGHRYTNRVLPTPDHACTVY